MLFICNEKTLKGFQWSHWDRSWWLNHVCTVKDPTTPWWWAGTSSRDACSHTGWECGRCTVRLTLSSGAPPLASLWDCRRESGRKRGETMNGKYITDLYSYAILLCYCAFQMDILNGWQRKLKFLSCVWRVWFNIL